MKNIKIENFLSFFIALFVFSFLIESFTFIKYIAITGSIIFFIINFYKNYQKVINNYKNYLNNRILKIFIFLIFSILISTFFGYGELQEALKEIRREFINISIIFILALSLDKKYLKNLFFAIIASFIFEILYNFYIYIKDNPSFNLSIKLNRNFSNYFEILYPFALISLFYFKNNLKFFIFIFILLGLFELFLTGARGGWIAALIETLIIIFFLKTLIFKNIFFFKKNIFLSFLISLSIIFGIYFLYQNSSLIKAKLNQKLNPSGRDIIVKTRFPIFLKHGNLFIGIGGVHNYQYNKFLNEHNAPKLYGKQEKDIFYYWSDEPFLLHLFYTNGLLGVFIFLILSFYLIYKSFKSKDIFLYSIAISYIGYYFIRGLVELRSLKYLFIYILLFLIFYKEKNEDSIPIS